jgi:gliding motility-associated-like protein
LIVYVQQARQQGKLTVMISRGKHICIAIACCIFFITPQYVTAQEICNNSIDDDGNSLIDLFDPACQCNFTVNGNLLSNGSFEKYDHCPLTYTYNSDYDITDYWKFGTYTNINEAYYYHNLTCTYDSTLVKKNMPPVLPLPQGNAFVSIQNIFSSTGVVPENETTKSYVSQCLQNPLKKDEAYTLSFYAGRFKSWDNLSGKIFPFTVAVFGNKDCNAVPFGKTNALGNGCPANYGGWILLGSTTIYSSGYWVESKVNFHVPYDINVIAVGPDCSLLPPVVDLADSTTFYDYHVYYLDDLHLLPTKDFPLWYIQVSAGIDCKSKPVLEAPVFGSATYQWYKDSIAIAGATNNTYNVLDDAGLHYYNALITTGDSCITTEPFLITPSKLDQVHVPADTDICDDNVLLLAPAITGITYTVNGFTDTSVRINAEGSYTITATDIYGCQRNFTSIVIKQNCSDCIAFIPSAFTPNNDGLNDIFRPRLYCALSRFHFSIYNRWGKKIFETNDTNKAWDGIYNGQKLPVGSYVYLIDYTTLPGIKKTNKGVITLIR